MSRWILSALLVLVIGLTDYAEVKANSYSTPETIVTGEVVRNSEYVWKRESPEVIIHMKTGERHTLPVNVSVVHNVHSVGDGRFILKGSQQWVVWDIKDESKATYAIEPSSGLDTIVATNKTAETILWKGNGKYVITSMSGKILGAIPTESMYEAYGLLDDGNILGFVNGEVTKRQVTGEVIERLGTYSGQVQGAQPIEEANQWVLSSNYHSDHFVMFDLATKQWIEKEAPGFNNMVWKDNVYYFLIRKMYTTYYVSYNFETGQWRESPIDDVFVKKRGPWYVFSNHMSQGYTPESFWSAPWKLLVDVPKTTTRYEVDRVYNVIGKSTLVDGTEIIVPHDELTLQLGWGENPFTFEDGKLKMQKNGSYDFSFKWRYLERQQDLLASNYVPFTLDPLVGVLGPISGTTVPNTPVFISVYKIGSLITSKDALQNIQSTTIQSDASGKFIWQPSRWFIPGSTVTARIGRPADVYADPIERRIVKESEDTSSNGISILTNTIESGITLQGKPNEEIELLVRSGKNYEVWNETLDSKGILKIKSFDHMLFDIGVKVYFKPKEAPASQFRLATIERYNDIPEFTWARTPLMHDTSINVTSSSTKGYLIFRNGKQVTTTRTMPYTFEAPLKEGEVITVTRHNGDATFEMTKTVQAFTPSLQVTDLLVSKTQTTLSIKTSTGSALEFYVNGKRVTATRASNRYTVMSNPGDIIRVRAVVGSKSREVTQTVPKTVLSTLVINDEQTSWTGNVLPNSEVVLKQGATVIGKAKSNSTGRVVLSFKRLATNTTVSLTSINGVMRHVQTIKVNAGVTPAITFNTPTATSKTMRVKSNVPYGTVTLYRGSTLLSKKTVNTTTTDITFATQKKGTKLTLRFVTPKGRSVLKTIYVK